MNKYGLIGAKLGHSLSKKIHEDYYLAHNINATYDLLEVDIDGIYDLILKLKNNEYQGFNVTVPYKETIIKYVDELTLSAKNINAVNTIYLKDGKVIGDNTDYLGFIGLVENANLDLNNKNVYVLGSGGSSKAICYALEKLNANYKVVSRKEGYLSYLELEKVDKIDLIVNTTPIGMWPNINDEILKEEIIKKASFCIDLIYNPEKTMFLKNAKNGKNGMEMLIIQALEAEKLWGN